MSSDEAAATLGFVHLTDAMEGADTWILIGAIWGVEKSPLETTTVVKTAEGPVMVTQGPDEVFYRIAAVATDLSGPSQAVVDSGLDQEWKEAR